MEVRAVGYSAQNTSTSDNVSKSSLSVDDFLRIMAAEISNQSPLGSQGGSQTDYISQLSQLTSLEQMSSISDSLGVLTIMSQQQISLNLVGKEVKLQDGEEIITGIVDKVKYKNGYTIIEVNENDYYLGSVLEVINSEVEEEE